MPNVLERSQLTTQLFSENKVSGRSRHNTVADEKLIVGSETMQNPFRHLSRKEKKKEPPAKGKMKLKERLWSFKMMES